MAELDFMESLALGMIAGRSGNQLGEAGVSILSDLRHKQQVAEADAAYAALVDEYNYVVDRHDAVVERFWRVHGHYKEWRDEAEKLAKTVRQLQQELVSANERAGTAETRGAALEQWGDGLAVREAEAQRDATYYKNSYRSVRDLANEDARQLAKAQAEIVRLKAIIEGVGHGDDQGTPPSEPFPP